MEHETVRKHLDHFGLYRPDHPEMGAIVHNLAQLKAWRLDPTSRAEFKDGRLEVEMSVDLSVQGRKLHKAGVALSRTAMEKIVEQLAHLQRDVKHPLERHESELKVLVDSATSTRGKAVTPIGVEITDEAEALRRILARHGVKASLDNEGLHMLLAAHSNLPRAVDSADNKLTVAQRRAKWALQDADNAVQMRRHLQTENKKIPLDRIRTAAERAGKEFNELISGPKRR